MLNLYRTSVNNMWSTVNTSGCYIVYKKTYRGTAYFLELFPQKRFPGIIPEQGDYTCQERMKNRKKEGWSSFLE